MQFLISAIIATSLSRLLSDTMLTCSHEVYHRPISIYCTTTFEGGMNRVMSLSSPPMTNIQRCFKVFGGFRATVTPVKCILGYQLLTRSATCVDEDRKNILAFSIRFYQFNIYIDFAPVIGEIFGHHRLRSLCLQVQPVTC